MSVCLCVRASACECVCASVCVCVCTYSCSCTSKLQALTQPSSVVQTYRVYRGFQYIYCTSFSISIMKLNTDPCTLCRCDLVEKLKR